MRVTLSDTTYFEAAYSGPPRPPRARKTPGWYAAEDRRNGIVAVMIG